MGLGNGFWIAPQPGWPGFPDRLIRLEAIRGTISSEVRISPLSRVSQPAEIGHGDGDCHLRN
jgi:hypothetical protein